MNKVTGGEPPLDADLIEREMTARDRDVDASVRQGLRRSTAIRRARSYLGDRLIRVAPAARAARSGGTGR